MNGWLKALLIVAGILGILLLVRLGVRVSYRENVLRLWLCISPFRIPLYSSAGKKKKKKPKKKKKKPQEKPEEKKKKPKKKRSFREILTMAGEIGGILKRLMRRIRIERLEAEITAAGPDAARAAITYGRLWEAVGTLHALLDNLVTLKRWNVQVGLDYSAEKLRAEGTAEITFRNLYILAMLLGLIRVGWRHRKLIQGEEVPQKESDKDTIEPRGDAAEQG